MLDDKVMYSPREEACNIQLLEEGSKSTNTNICKSTNSNVKTNTKVNRETIINYQTLFENLNLNNLKEKQRYLYIPLIA